MKTMRRLSERRVIHDIGSAKSSKGPAHTRTAVLKPPPAVVISNQRIQKVKSDSNRHLQYLAMTELDFKI